MPTYKQMLFDRLNIPSTPVESLSLSTIVHHTNSLRECFGEAPVPTNVVFIGAGGVASWFLPQYLKTLFALKTAREHTEKTIITLVDFDTVENKNILRQNFIPEDVGKNKAQVLAERYSEIYENIEVRYIKKYFYYDTAFYRLQSNESPDAPYKEMVDYIANNAESFLSLNIRTFYQQVFNFVDNEFTKHMIDLFLEDSDFFSSTFSSYYCTGCDVSNGQVFVKKFKNSPYYSQYYQDVTFNDLEESLEDRTSCAELVDLANQEQTFDSNTLAANLLNILVNNNLKNFWNTRTKEIKFICSGAPSVTTKTDFDVFSSSPARRLSISVGGTKNPSSIKRPAPVDIPITPNTSFNLGLS